MKRLTPTLLLVAMSFASLEAMAAADLVLFNGQTFSADHARPKAQALAVENGKILQTGSDPQIKNLIDSHTRVVDLGGKTLMPGLIDTHSHAIFGGLEMTSANMQDEVVSLHELEKRLRAWRDDGTAKHADVLSLAGISSAYWAQAEALGRRFNQEEWASVPVVFTGSDHHTAWANDIMLKRAGGPKGGRPGISRAAGSGPSPGRSSGLRWPGPGARPGRGYGRSCPARDATGCARAYQ